MFVVNPVWGPNPMLPPVAFEIVTDDRVLAKCNTRDDADLIVRAMRVMGRAEEVHRLVVLAEECAEVAQRATKAIRFGMPECEPGQDKNNHERLEQELGDLMGVADMLGVVPDSTARSRKAERVERYMHYARRLGLL